MTSQSISFEITEDLRLHPQRERDRCINDVLKEHLESEELAKINKIRISLQVITLADITAADGKKNFRIQSKAFRTDPRLSHGHGNL